MESFEESGRGERAVCIVVSPLRGEIGSQSRRYNNLRSPMSKLVGEFVVRSDMACGSTIGPDTAAVTGVRTVDVGVAQLAMHSARETCGRRDAERFVELLTAFLGGS